MPPSLDQALTSEDDPFAESAAGLEDLVVDDDATVPAIADPEVGTVGAGAAAATAGSNLLSFQESSFSHQQVSGKIGQQHQPQSRLSGAPAGSSPVRPATVPAATGGGRNGGAAVGTGGSGSVAPADDLQQRFSRFNIKYYRCYFNVDTKDVGMRMLDSLLCAVRPNFLEKHGESPDLYGPFWISTTIVFLIAVVSNYIGWQNSGGEGEAATAAWKYDTDKVTISAALFYGYVGVVGFGIWAVLRWFSGTVTLANIWCIYGYGLSIFLPISILCAIPSVLVRWVLVGASTLVSGLFILLNLRTPVFETAGAKAVPLYICMALLHLGLGLSLKLYFFRYKAIT